MTTDTAVNALSLALAAARREGRAVHSIKDLLCDACGEAAAMREGLCHRCNDEAAAHYAARSAEVLPAIMAAQTDDPARWCVGDDEGELLARGVRC